MLEVEVDEDKLLSELIRLLETELLSTWLESISILFFFTYIYIDITNYFEYLLLIWYALQKFKQTF